MAGLIMGPMLRYVDETSATVWVETDAPCTVQVVNGQSLDAESPTFTVHGHHYAVVDVMGLVPGSSTEYTVRLDGEQVWPEPGSAFPPSRIRAVDPEARIRVMFGTCRTSAPHDEEHMASHGVDMLRAYAHRFAEQAEEWPSVVLLLGDQVYADTPPEEMKEFIRARRDVSQPPGEEIADFDEYAELYRLAWVDPSTRWLLSTVPTAMIFDDHDLRDDWNTSLAWRQMMRNQAWWHERVVAGLGAYWIYQHLGNLSPAERAADPVFKALRAADGDGGTALDDFAWRTDQDPSQHRWSFHRDYGRVRLVVLDSRCSRVLEPGRRAMYDDQEWEWFEQLATGDCDHLLIGTSLPFLLPTGVHYLENWNEAVCDGAWGWRAARVGEKIRQAIDLEHWAAFRRSFELMARLVVDVATGRRATSPASVMFLSGDVHFSYLARATLPEDSAPVYQLVCSPIRNPLHKVIRWANVVACFGILTVLGRLLARAARVKRPPVSWTIERGPWFSNALATVDLDGRSASAYWQTASDKKARKRRRFGRRSRKGTADMGVAGKATGAERPLEFSEFGRGRLV